MDLKAGGETIPRRFSHRTMALCCDGLQRVLTDAQLQNFFTRFGLLEIYRRLPQGTAKLKRVQDVVAYLSRDGATDATDELWDEIISEGVRLLSQHAKGLGPLWEELVHALRVDGYDVDHGRILLALSAGATSRHVRCRIENRLLELGWHIPLRHLEQVHSNYALGHWEAANASLRSFLQSVFDQIAEQLPGFNPHLKPGGERRRFLQDIGFLTNDEGQLTQALFSILNTKGSHPGLSDENDCSSRITISLGLAWRVLSRLNP